MDNVEQALLALLKKLEWSGQGRAYDYGDFAKVCPICYGAKPLYDGDDDQRGAGHIKDCELNRLIFILEKRGRL